MVNTSGVATAIVNYNAGSVLLCKIVLRRLRSTTWTYMPCPRFHSFVKVLNLPRIPCSNIIIYTKSWRILMDKSNWDIKTLDTYQFHD